MSEKPTSPGHPAFTRQDGVRLKVARFPVFAFFSCLFLLSLCAAAATPLIISSEDGPAGSSPDVLEAEIKSVFLYHFGGYVDWPPGTFADENDPLVIGVSGVDVASSLREIVRTRTIRNRPVTVVRVREGDDAGRLHILYIADDTDPETAARLFDSVRGGPVLTVTDQAYAGAGVITFVLERDRVRFDVSLPRAEASGLRVSARLLSVARRVEELRQ